MDEAGNPGVAPIAKNPATHAEQAAALKIATDKEVAKQEQAAKMISTMEAGIRDRLFKLCDELGGEYHKAFEAYSDMPLEMHFHPMYKGLGERIASVEAMLNSLMIAAAAFPKLEDPEEQDPKKLAEQPKQTVVIGLA